MAIVVLTSASGSPGVTTTAVGMAFSWPRPVLLVEADPTGGSGILAGTSRTGCDVTTVGSSTTAGFLCGTSAARSASAKALQLS